MNNSGTEIRCFGVASVPLSDHQHVHVHTNTKTFQTINVISHPACICRWAQSILHICISFTMSSLHSNSVHMAHKQGAHVPFQKFKLINIGYTLLLFLKQNASQQHLVPTLYSI